MNDLFRASAHARLHHGRVLVIKIGGSSLARPPALRSIARQIAVVQAFGAKPVLVHGGGPQTDALQQQLGAEPRKVGGRRVTGPKALRALTFAVAGELNTQLAASLTAAGAPAVGLSAASAGIARARRRPPVTTEEGVVDFGHVGDLVAVEPAPVAALVASGSVPVLCPPAADAEGALLNVNADLLAAALAVALGAAKLILLTGAPGILEDPADPTSLFSTLTLAELRALGKGGALADGMAVKAAAIEHALEGGVERVHVVSGEEDDALLRELYTNQGAGTLLTVEAQAEAVAERALA